ncbi:hypothetical protein O181_010492 [Austropuccinia psidii MF-1]|uniref:Uncharacterized protein n=1 Tax=Austropuccinia psidii MF-1 TaxID=1389203 RepID=A0A9Q3BTU4_9BASI|nr:hypothetical protein [Austropuccinia psidii MF-1]
MELIDYIDGLFIDVLSIPDYWITDRHNAEFKGHSSLWYTEIKEIHGGRFRLFKNTATVLGYGKGPYNMKMTTTLWKNIHMSGVLESLKDSNPLILK